MSSLWTLILLIIILLCYRFKIDAIPNQIFNLNLGIKFTFSLRSSWCVQKKMDYPPNNTLYVSNLNEKVKSEGEYGLVFACMFAILVARDVSQCIVGFHDIPRDCAT